MGWKLIMKYLNFTQSQFLISFELNTYNSNCLQQALWLPTHLKVISGNLKENEERTVAPQPIEFILQSTVAVQLIGSCRLSFPKQASSWQIHTSPIQRKRNIFHWWCIVEYNIYETSADLTQSKAGDLLRVRHWDMQSSSPAVGISLLHHARHLEL